MLYPLKFEPLLKDKIWGGSKLKKLFSKTSTSSFLGESWEISGHEGNESIVSNGFLAGNNLTELIEVYMGELIGDKVYNDFGLTFPLLFKLIDANDNLSIQVHPNDEVAADRHDTFGKTEMWYVVDAEPDSKLILGFTKDCTRDNYLDAIENNTVEEFLQQVPVSKGDVFFIPAGLVHSIGSGIVLAEIQQNSDITYRIYDYKRTDGNGKERELHIENALDVIDYSALKHPKVNYSPVLNESVQLVTTEYFTTSLLQFNKALNRQYYKIDSFVVYMCIDGSFVLDTTESKTIVSKGETILIPACIDEVNLYPENEAKILEIYIS